MKQAAGTILYRKVKSGIEVLLVHPSGNYNRNAPWSIPKGELDPNETPEQTARRETLEETGVVARALEPLGSIQYKKSKKVVHGFVGKAPEGAAPFRACWEVDRAEFVPLTRAYELLHPDQRTFLDRLQEKL